MKNGFSFVALFAFALTGCLSSGPRSQSPESLPADWYLLPEHGGPSEFQESAQAEIQVGARVDRIFRATLSAMPQSYLEHTSAVDGHVPYHLAGIFTVLGVSGDGVLGALVFNGSATVETAWGPVDETSVTPAQTRKSERTLSFSGKIPAEAFEKRLELLTHTLMATGRIHDEQRLRASLSRVGSRFLEITRVLDSLKPASQAWVPGEFRVEVGLDASGAITPVVQAGASVSTRFDWTPGEAAESSDGKALALASSSPLWTPLKKLTAIFSEDLDTAYLEARAEELKQFHLKLEQIRFRLGFGADGSVGIAQGSAEFVAILCLVRNQAAQKSEGENMETTETVPVIANMSDPEIRAYANNKSVGPQAAMQLVQVKRSAWKNGVKKAISLGKFFAKHAVKARTTRWKLIEMTAEFDVSLSGTVGLATVAGAGGLELNFANEGAN